MSRSIPLWIGKTDDEKVPDRVRLRIWRREDGVCHISKMKILPSEDWHLEHRKALVDGGRHSEDNLFPALIEPHKAKSKDEAALRAKADAVAKRHVGITRPVAKIASAPFIPSDRSAKRQPKPPVAGLPAIARRFQNG